MPTELTLHANDESTFVVTAAFTDEEGTAVTPNAGLTWSLRSAAGSIINSRSDVAITAASTITIVLSGDDLKYSDGNTRYLTIEGTYNSTLGNNLSVKDEVSFLINDLIGV